GEFFSHAAVHYLCRLGVEPFALGAVAIDEVGLARHRGTVNSKLPFRALSLSRRRLDEALIERAGAAGAEVLRRRNVNRLETAAGAWSARLADGEVLRARDVFIATGKHELRGWNRPISSRNDLIGMKVHFRLTESQTAELDRRVELVLFPGGYGGLEPIEQGMANLCLLVRKRRFAELGNSWPNLLAAIRRSCPHLDGRLRGAEPVQHRPLTIASIPYGFVRSSTGACWHLGDQAAVIPSF